MAKAAASGGDALIKMPTAARAPTRALSPLELWAIAKLYGAAKEVREELKEGDGQVVDVVVHLHGTLSVKADGTTTEYCLPEPADVLGHVFSHVAPRTRKKIIAAVAALYDGKEAKERVEPDKECLAAGKSLVTQLTRVHISDRAGSVYGNVSAEAIDVPPPPRVVQKSKAA